MLYLEIYAKNAYLPLPPVYGLSADFHDVLSSKLCDWLPVGDIIICRGDITPSGDLMARKIEFELLLFLGD